MACTTRVSNVFKDFKEFINKGNVVDLAVAFILSAGFREVISSAVDNVITPIISIILDSIGIATGSLEDVFFVFRDGTNLTSYETLASAQEDGAITFNHGPFMLELFDFFLIALACFIIVKVYVNTIKGKDKEERKCHECLEVVKDEALRCPHCACTLEPPTGMLPDPDIAMLENKKQ